MVLVLRRRRRRPRRDRKGHFGRHGVAKRATQIWNESINMKALRGGLRREAPVGGQQTEWEMEESLNATWPKVDRGQRCSQSFAPLHARAAATAASREPQHHTFIALCIDWPQPWKALTDSCHRRRMGHSLAEHGRWDECTTG